MLPWLAFTMAWGLGQVPGVLASPAGLIGQPAPAFRLTGSDGRTHDLKQFRGRQPVVLVWNHMAYG